MKKIKKEQTYILSLFLIIVASIILFLFPEIVKYPYSYSNIEEKRNLIMQGNSQLNANESQIKVFAAQKEASEKEGNKINNEALTLKRNIKESDFKLDIPSLLISLEQKSYKDDLELTIHYNEIKLVNSDENYSENPSDKVSKVDGSESPAKDVIEETEEKANESKEDEEDKKTVGGEPVDNKDKAEDEKSDDKKEDEIKFSEEDIEKGVLKVEGLDTTIIPIVVKGSYSSVRNYIKYLDEIGMIEPSSVELSSEGREITAKIILNVFHGEVL